MTNEPDVCLSCCPSGFSRKVKRSDGTTQSNPLEPHDRTRRCRPERGVYAASATILKGGPKSFRLPRLQATLKRAEARAPPAFGPHRARLERGVAVPSCDGKTATR